MISGTPELGRDQMILHAVGIERDKLELVLGVDRLPVLGYIRVVGDGAYRVGCNAVK